MGLLLEYLVKKPYRADGATDGAADGATDGATDAGIVSDIPDTAPEMLSVGLLFKKDKLILKSSLPVSDGVRLEDVTTDISGADTGAGACSLVVDLVYSPGLPSVASRRVLFCIAAVAAAKVLCPLIAFSSVVEFANTMLDAMGATSASARCLVLIALRFAAEATATAAGAGVPLALGIAGLVFLPAFGAAAGRTDICLTAAGVLLALGTAVASCPLLIVLDAAAAALILTIYLFIFALIIFCLDKFLHS